MSIISIANPKGGCGKTTLSTNLARALFEEGRRVLLVDSDPQGSARDWHAARENNAPPLVTLDRAANLRQLALVAAAYDDAVIDGAAKLEDMVAAAIKVADLVLIPVQPSPYDIWAVSDLVELISARRDVTDGVPVAAFVVARAIHGTTLGGEVDGALAEHGLPVLDARMVQRQVYPQTSARGLTVFDAPGPAAAAARAEVIAIAVELRALLAPARSRA